MIQLAHVATGALAGGRSAGLLDAFIAGVATHAAIDAIPHGEVRDDEFEFASGAAGILVLALRHGWRSPVTIGAIGAAMPDLEHVPQRLGVFQPTLFPTHRVSWLHGWEGKPLAIPAWAQALLGGAVIGVLAVNRRHGTVTAAAVTSDVSPRRPSGWLRTRPLQPLRPRQFRRGSP